MLQFIDILLFYKEFAAAIIWVLCKLHFFYNLGFRESGIYNKLMTKLWDPCERWEVNSFPAIDIKSYEEEREDV